LALIFTVLAFHCIGFLVGCFLLWLWALDFYQVDFDPAWFWAESTLGWVALVGGRVDFGPGGFGLV